MDLSRYSSYQDICRRFRWEIPEYYNIASDTVDKWADHRGRVALFYQDQQGHREAHTFRLLQRASNRLANLLAELGVTKGDRVGIVVPQTPETASAHLAVYKLGAMAVPLSILYAPDTLKYMLGDCAAKALIIDQAQVEKVRRIRSELPALRHVIVRGAAAEGELSLQNAMARHSPQFQTVRTRSADPAMLLYTSGTTGPSKGTLHTHRILVGYLLTFSLFFNLHFNERSVFYTPSDWAWVGGLLDILLPALSLGYPVLGYNGRFEPSVAWELMAEYGVTHAFLTPTALKLLAQTERPRERYDLDLQVIASGGESVADEVLRWVNTELGAVCNEFYGLTEVNHLVGNCAQLWPVRPGSMGRPYPGREVDVIDEAGHSVPPGTVGQIVVKRGDPTMFLEYWGKPEKTQERFQGEWVLTGDLAERDADGYIWFKGRQDDLIKSGGYRIGPSEVEEALLHHPAVAEVAVIGAPDPLRGAIVKALVKLAAGYEGSPALVRELQETVKERLAAYKYPREVEFVTDLATTTTGKLNRRLLRLREEEKRRG